MKIKRFFAADMRQAIRMVRQELGADAVILSNKRVNGGLEVVAAMDYEEGLLEQTEARDASPAVMTLPDDADAVAQAAAMKPRARVAATASVYETYEQRSGETRPAPKVSRANQIEWSQEPTLVEMRNELQGLRDMVQNQLSGLAWGDMARSRPVRADMIRRLKGLGLSMALAREMAEHAQSDEVEQGWREVLSSLARNVPVAEETLIHDGGIIALVGSTGVGKTTTVAKLAARFALRHGARNVALVTTDSYRIGAHEQLRIYGQLLGMPVHVANNAEELRETLRSLADKKLVLIDTAGMSQRDLRLTEQFGTLHGGSSLIRSYLVLPATSQAAVLTETIGAFAHMALDGCILTKVDEAVSLGGALNAVIQHQLPLAYVTDGQRVPEDLHPARVHNLLKQAVLLAHKHEEKQDEDALAIAYGAKVMHAQQRP